MIKKTSKTVKVIKLIVLIIILLLLMKVPTIKYTKQNSGEIDGYISLEVKKSWDELVYIEEGKEKLEAYIQEKRLDNIKDNTLILYGNLPWNELSEYKDGDPIFNKIKIYGEFTNKLNDENILYFSVSKWELIERNVNLSSSYIWKKIGLPYYIILVADIYFIIISLRRLIGYKITNIK
ncbi:hypothetical protein [Clostridium intestinale]|uniref:Uncharacterized protein n=1 Tax=Clostridium intestinale URNW TaxID=1294142 RepID=U2NSC1_9CLOT|nr:hypothetical protein [Clostridium intestinale]ERK32048.1 hypothetical protein CINTURNW_0567 [Clostridium intestinale URNW]